MLILLTSISTLVAIIFVAMWSAEKEDNEWLRKQNNELLDQNKHLTWQVNTTKEFYETMRDWAEFLVEQKWKVMKENEELKSKIENGTK